MQPFDIIHVDIWGPYSQFTYKTCRYFLTIVDDFSRYTWVFLLIFKFDAIDALIKFHTFVKTHHQIAIKTIQSDNKSEFLSFKLQSFFHSQGIRHQRSCPHTPQQNGVVERKHRHLLNVACALRFHSRIPLSFWGDCVLTATQLINCLPTPLLQNKSPYEILHKTSPTYDHIRVFGSLCYASSGHLHSDKFGSRSRCYVFIGYSTNYKGYHLFDLHDHTIFISRDIIFYENIFPFRATHDSTSPQPNIVIPLAVPNDPLPVPSPYIPMAESNNEIPNSLSSPALLPTLVPH